MSIEQMDKTDKALVVADKVLDFANEIYDDTLKKPLTKISNGLSICMDFLGAAIHPKLHEYIKNAEYKIKEIDEKLEEKYNKIPEEKRVEPRMNILGPSTDLLKYNLDEKYIKDIFINLLSSEMNSDKQDKVLPSFIEIARQLSCLDAKTLQSLVEAMKETKSNSFSLDVIQLGMAFQPSAYVTLSKVIVVSASHFITPQQIVIDNLSRLKLIEIEENKEVAGSQLYGRGFNHEKQKYANCPGTLNYSKGIFRITEFGQAFLDICFN